MKTVWSVFGVFFLSSSSLFAEEVDPVAKVKLAIGEADQVLNLVDKASDDDPLLDMMCLRLGRFSAILRRIRNSVPVPPEDTRKHYVHYEHFCGWEPRPTDAPVENLLPRGFSLDAIAVRQAIDLLETQLQKDRDALEVWVKAQEN